MTNNTDICDYDVNRSSECVNNLSFTSPKVSTILREGQGHRQIGNIPDGFVVKDDTELGYMNVIPLWHFGLNY